VVKRIHYRRKWRFYFTQSGTIFIVAGHNMAHKIGHYLAGGRQTAPQICVKEVHPDGQICELAKENSS
jgi:hypothetical protein